MAERLRRGARLRLVVNVSPTDLLPETCPYGVTDLSSLWPLAGALEHRTAGGVAALPDSQRFGRLADGDPDRRPRHTVGWAILDHASAIWESACPHLTAKATRVDRPPAEEYFPFVSLGRAASGRNGESRVSCSGVMLTARPRGRILKGKRR